MTAVGILAALSPNYALAQQVQFTDPDIVAEYITYPSPKGHGEVRAYLVMPARAEGPVPGVGVAHENRGLNPYIQDVARRVAKAGFAARAPGGRSRVGAYPGNDAGGRGLERTGDPEERMRDRYAAAERLLGAGRTASKLGISGCCYGGGVSRGAAVGWPAPAAP